MNHLWLAECRPGRRRQNRSHSRKSMAAANQRHRRELIAAFDKTHEELPSPPPPRSRAEELGEDKSRLSARTKPCRAWRCCTFNAANTKSTMRGQLYTYLRIAGVRSAAAVSASKDNTTSVSERQSHANHSIRQGAPLNAFTHSFQSFMKWDSDLYESKTYPSVTQIRRRPATTLLQAKPGERIHGHRLRLRTI